MFFNECVCLLLFVSGVDVLVDRVFSGWDCSQLCFSELLCFVEWILEHSHLEHRNNDISTFSKLC